MTLLGLRMRMEEYRVLITTSGVGSRLGKLTDFTNKSLVRIGSKAAITRIIEMYPNNAHFIVTLGHFGNHVKEYLKIAHCDRHFTFVEVDNFDSAGSSQLYSMNCAKPYLQCPFIFHACDTLATWKILPPNVNWVTAAKIEHADQYSTLKIDSNFEFEGFSEKGEISFDYAYPGICGIKDYDLFWSIVENLLSTLNKKSLSDCHVINEMVKRFRKTNERKFHIVELDKWYDIGNAAELERTRIDFEEDFDILDKSCENIYFLEKSVIKFFHDSEMVRKRVERMNHLSGLTPALEEASEHFFKYKFVIGSLFSNSVTLTKMNKFLEWALNNLWDKNPKEDISTECYNFYFEKTKNRVNQFLNGIPDREAIINGEKIPHVKEMINLIDKEWLCNGTSSIIHGDLILDNIIETPTGFVLIDWRQDFAGRLDIGDIYYDLAKLNHNLIFNHELIKQGCYTLNYDKNNIICDILCRKTLMDCKELLHKFIEDKGYDLRKVKLLTSLIWINMSPLHEHPLNKFLFNFGKYNLFCCLKEEGKI